MWPLKKKLPWLSLERMLQVCPIWLSSLFVNNGTPHYQKVVGSVSSRKDVLGRTQVLLKSCILLFYSQRFFHSLPFPPHCQAPHCVYEAWHCASIFFLLFTCFFASIPSYHLQTRTLNDTALLKIKLFYLDFNLCIRPTCKTDWELHGLNLYLDFPITTFLIELILLI